MAQARRAKVWCEAKSTLEQANRPKICPTNFTAVQDAAAGLEKALLRDG
jgi:hypothetical protein